MLDNDSKFRVAHTIIYDSDCGLRLNENAVTAANLDLECFIVLFRIVVKEGHVLTLHRAGGQKHHRGRERLVVRSSYGGTKESKKLICVILSI